eukprot:TRINITY_DN30267_c0_g1_i1.p1 TRINITY_DN30267_c0_g1~~TRINITY_DN30267_c0_g1_i1.p1  ORF type:complete len:861 (+),score=174.46 TRINITY_DN30267_c0_g1_i1:160-2583(+)
MPRPSPLANSSFRREQSHSDRLDECSAKPANPAVGPELFVIHSTSQADEALKKVAISHADTGQTTPGVSASAWQDKIQDEKRAPAGCPSIHQDNVFSKAPTGHTDGVPFVSSQDEVLRKRLAGRHAEVEALRSRIDAALSDAGPAPCRLAGLRQLLLEAQSLRDALLLSETQLEKAGWPLSGLQRLQNALELIDRWDALLPEIRQRLAAPEPKFGSCSASGEAGGGIGGPALLKKLAQAWAALANPGALPRGVDFDIQGKARSAQALVSALADRLASDARVGGEATAGLRQSLAAVLGDQAVRRTLVHGLGAELPRVEGGGGGGGGANSRSLQQSMSEQKKQAALSTQASEQPLLASLAACDAASDSLLRSCDVPSSRTGFGLALTKGLCGPALAIWKRFPPQLGESRGVDVAEVQAETGDTFMHVVCALKHFDQQAAELFTNLLSACRKLPVLRATNASGQSFLHIAASRLNFWVLVQTLSSVPELADFFFLKDHSRRSPASLLAKHLRARCCGGARPSCPVLLQGDPGSQPFEENDNVIANPDVELEVQDESAARPMRLMSRRQELSAASKRWDEELRLLSSSEAGTEGKLLLQVDPGCCRSFRALRAALDFVRAGTPPTSLEGDGRALWQLLSLCIKYQLPELLRRHACSALLRSLGSVENLAVLPLLMRGARASGLRQQERCYVLHCLLTQPEALASADHDKSGHQRKAKTLLAALAELEQLVAGSTSEKGAVTGAGEAMVGGPRTQQPRAAEGAQLRQGEQTHRNCPAIARAADVPLEGAWLRRGEQPHGDHPTIARGVNKR